MELTISPSTGSQPYVIRSLLDGVESVPPAGYTYVLYSSSRAGSCPVDSVTPAPSAQADLISSGVSTRLVSEPAGSCRIYVLYIIRVTDGEVMRVSRAFIDNV